MLQRLFRPTSKGALHSPTSFNHCAVGSGTGRDKLEKARFIAAMGSRLLGSLEFDSRVLGDLVLPLIV